MDDLIKDAKPKRGRPKKAPQLSDELLMTSGLGLQDGAGANQDSEAPMTTDELAKSDDVPVRVAIAKPNRRPARPGRKVLHNEQQNKVLEGLKQRMEATAKDQRAKPAPKAPLETAEVDSDTIVVAQRSSVKATEPPVERSDFSLSPSPPPPGKLSTARRPSVVQPGSALRLQNTPAVEASMLALKNFKRRPRQLSMLQMVQQRTASARPSLANTAAADPAVQDTSVFDLDVSDEEDDFAPEAEGTPLKVTKAQRKSSAKKTAAVDDEFKSKSSTKKRKSTDVDSSMVSLSSSRSKRRKSTRDEDEVEESLPAAHEFAALPTSSARAATPLPAETSDIQVVNSPSTSTPPTEPSSTRHHSPDKEDDFAVPSTELQEPLVRSSPTPELEDEADGAIPNGTMAEPLSSSPVHRASKIMDSFDAPPMTQISPPAKPQRKKKVKPLTTSALQSLLPKKRAPMRAHRKKTEYDLESDSDEEGSQLDASHLEDDEDELGGALRRKKATPLKNAKRGRQGKGTTARASSKAPARKAPAASKSKKASRTYGRAATSDKENDGYDSAEEEEEESTLPEVSISMEDASLSKELEDAKKKFAEVDDFDMEFESMSHEDHRSSSQGWR